MQRVLFVDDEPNVLDGLRRTFRSFRQEWDMRFANGGREALAAMAANPIDVLITDMRMPEMAGDELLDIVRDRHPAVVRIVLTGQCTRESMLRLIPLAHRIFSKPCDPAELKAAVVRAASFQKLIWNPSLIALIGQMGSLPTPPVLHTRILEAIENPDGSIAEVGKLIGCDIGLASKLMQIANSAWVALRQPTTNPVHAVQVLGLDTTKAIVLAAGVFNRYDPKTLAPYSIDNVWEHSCAVGALAEKIMSQEGDAKRAGEARLAGLLHDVGRLTIACQQPETYKRVLHLVHETGVNLVEAERQVLQVSHAEAGAYLLGLWGLPSSIVETVAWHHTPCECPGISFDVLSAVHLAEAMLAPAEAKASIQAYLEHLGLSHRLAPIAALVESSEANR